MVGQRERETLSAPNRASGRQSAPWEGFVLLVFDRRPFVRSFFNRYVLAIFLGYPAIIAFAASQHWKLLAGWLNFWTPAVDIFRRIVPLFDNFEHGLIASGHGDRVGIIHHLIAFGWLVGVPIFLFLSFAVLQVPRDSWIRYHAVVPRRRIVLGFFLYTICFVGGVYWIVVGFGFTPENTVYGMPLFHWHIYDFALISIGIFFVIAIGCGVAVEVLLIALITQLWIRVPAKSISETTQRNSESRSLGQQTDV